MQSARQSFILIVKNTTWKTSSAHAIYPPLNIKSSTIFKNTLAPAVWTPAGSYTDSGLLQTFAFQSQWLEGLPCTDRASTCLLSPCWYWHSRNKEFCHFSPSFFSAVAANESDDQETYVKLQWGAKIIEEISILKLYKIVLIYFICRLLCILEKTI